MKGRRVFTELSRAWRPLCARAASAAERHNVIPSEYRTKEITSALLGLITVYNRGRTEGRVRCGAHRTRIRSDQLRHDTKICVYFSLC